ncbi:hypothetical protein, partial [Plasmodium yoelii yoelii]
QNIILNFINILIFFLLTI